MDAIEISLLCQLNEQGGPLNDGGAVLTGSGPPIGASTTSAAVYTDITNGALYYWDDVGAAWVKIIG